MRLPVCFFSLSLSLCAQNALAPHVVIWDDANLVVTHPGPGIAAQCESPNGKSLWKAPFPKSLMQGSMNCYDYCNGRLYLSEHKRAQDEKGSFFFTAIHVYEHGEWSVLAQGKYRKTADGRDQNIVPFEIYELDNGKFLSVDSTAREKGRKPFHIWSVTPKKEFNRVDDFDAGLDKPFYKENGDRQYPGLWDLGSYATVRCNGFLITASQNSAYFWVFSSQNGKLKRVMRLYSGLSEEVVQKKAGFSVLVGMQPTQSGDVLIAARTEDAALFGDDTRMKHSDKDAHSEMWWSEFLEFRKRHANETAKNFPGVLWWNLDPVNGQIYEVLPPKNVKSSLEDEASLRNFNWRFKSDGNLHFMDSKAFNETSKVEP